MESVNAEMGEMPVIKTLNEREPSSQPGTPAPPVWTEGSPQGFSHRFSRTRKVTARRNVNPAPSYILDMMRTDPHVEYNTIDLTCDDETSLKLQASHLTGSYNTLSTNSLQGSDSYHNLNNVDGFRKLASTPGIESYEALGITIDRNEYVPRNMTPSIMNHNPDLMHGGGMALKTGSNWADTPLDPNSLSQNQMLAMMLQTSEPIPRPWGRGIVEPNKNFTYPRVDLSKYGPLPQLEPIPPVFSEKHYQDTKPLPYPVPSSDLIPAKDIKCEVSTPVELSDMMSLESMQMRWSERMSSSASSECGTSIGSRNEESVDKNAAQLEQPSKRRRTGIHVPAVEPHLWTRKGLRPCAARLARSAEETMQLNSPVGDKDDTVSAWKMDVATRPQEAPSPQYSDISDAPSIPLSAQNSRHSRSSSISPHGSAVVLTEGTADNFISPKKSPSKPSASSLLGSAAISLKRCAVRVPRCSDKLSVSLASYSGSGSSETPKQYENDSPKSTTPLPDNSTMENLDDEAPFKCSLCMLRFWKEDLFRDHACLGRPWHQCPMCLSRFLSVANLQRHMANKHSSKYEKPAKTKKTSESTAKAFEKENIESVELPTDDVRTKSPKGISETDIHEWLYSVWDYNKTKPIPPDGIKCLFCEKVCFQVLSVKAHLLGVHKINLFNRQFQTQRNSQFVSKNDEKANSLTSSNANTNCVLPPGNTAAPEKLGKAKSGIELKKKIASLLLCEIEKNKQKASKPEKQDKSNNFEVVPTVSKEQDNSLDKTVSSKSVGQAPNGIIKTVGLLAKGKPKEKFHYVRSLCQTMIEKKVSVVQLRNWLLEINTGTFDRYECILCVKVFNTLKSMQSHCLSVHRIPPQIKSFKPIWKGMRELRVNLQSQTEASKNEPGDEIGSARDHSDVELGATSDMKRELTNCLSKNLRNLLVKSHLVGRDDSKDNVEADVRDVVQYAVHSVSEEAMVASMKQFHPPVIKGIVKVDEESPVASKLDKKPPSTEEIDNWLTSLKSAIVAEQGSDHQIECLMCSETVGDVESMATHVSLVHRLTGLPLPQSSKEIGEDVDTQASEEGDPSVASPPLPFNDLSDLRMYTKVLLMRLYTDETLSAFGFPECSIDQVLMRILEHSGFSYCWFEDVTEELQHNAVCRNLKTLLAVSLPPEIKAHINLNSNPMPVVLKDLLEYTADEQLSASDEG